MFVNDLFICLVIITTVKIIRLCYLCSEAFFRIKEPLGNFSQQASKYKTFSTIDLYSAYHQIPIQETKKHLLHLNLT